jgi:adenine-specific DNA-methyltransferase
MTKVDPMQSSMDILLGHEPDAEGGSSVPDAKPISHQADLGQFMTPPNIARFMAGMFASPMPPKVRLLEAGAGRAALTSAFVERWLPHTSDGLEAHAYEYDHTVTEELRAVLAACEQNRGVSTRMFGGDFIDAAASMICLGRGPRYTHAILNPPYKKINSDSKHRQTLRAIGLETVNLYTGFLGLVIELLQDGGQVVTIIPRSFCNGPYYKPFRSFMFKRVAIRHIHLFASRNKTFKADAVLQENVIIHLQRGVPQKDVTISTSTDDTFVDYTENKYPFTDIVFDNDPEQFIHIPTGDAGTELEDPNVFRVGLEELGIGVSTGPVVDFRLRKWLCPMPETGTVPLLYSGHFSSAGIKWPIPGQKKPNAIKRNTETEKWLYPNGFYTVVRRFSSKEEKRRIVSSVVDPTLLPAEVLGFENHLNVFHERRRPLPELLARGLSVFLNSTMADQCFRQFNGHTQVNATDLRQMKYPARETLVELGSWAKDHAGMTQKIIDQRIASLIMAHPHIESAIEILSQLGFPRAQLNERSGLALLAVLDLTPSKRWNAARNPLIGITPIMDWIAAHYDKKYAPNTRETVRRQTMHQFMDAGLVLYNPDDPLRPVNSPRAVYQVSPEALTLIRAFETPEWAAQLEAYISEQEGLAARYVTCANYSACR